MQTVIKMADLTKVFGNNRGVHQLDFTVEKGSIVGFLGPNGAGKSTTINMLINYTTPSSGKGFIFGRDITKESSAIRKDIGYLASDMTLDNGLTGRQQIQFIGNLRGRLDTTYVNELCRRLDCELDRKIGTLSRGNRQKIALVTALAHQPELLLLDEPTSGLDPLIQSVFNEIILEHKAAGKTAFISSHVLSEVQELCDRIIFIRQGRIIADKPMRELLDTAPKIVQLKDGNPLLVKRLKALEGVTHLKDSADFLNFEFSGDINQLLAVLAKQPVRDLTISDTPLDELFQRYYSHGEGNA